MTYDFKKKAHNVNQLNNYMIAKTLSMFEYQNLPDTIPYQELERLLQVNGFAFVTKVNGKLYAFNGGLGGEPDTYGNPTTITISNPYLKFNETLNLENDGVLFVNDDEKIGLMPLFEKFNFMLIENDINMILHGYNTRMKTLISASDDKTKESAENYVKKSVDGEIAIIGENALFEGVKLHGSTAMQGVAITTMIEYHQFIKSMLFNEIGLSTSFNMKKERMITSEIEQHDDGIFPFVYNMMKVRLKAIERLNELYGLNLSIDFGSVWNIKNRRLVDDVIDNEATTTPETPNDPLPTDNEPSNEPINEPSNEPTPTDNEPSESDLDKTPSETKYEPSSEKVTDGETTVIVADSEMDLLKEMLTDSTLSGDELAILKTMIDELKGADYDA